MCRIEYKLALMKMIIHNNLMYSDTFLVSFMCGIFIYEFVRIPIQAGRMQWRLEPRTVYIYI